MDEDGRTPHRPGSRLRTSYGPADLPAAESIPPPGSFPFTRGNFPDGYRGRMWTIRQYSGLRHPRGVERALPLPARPRRRPGCRWPSTSRPSAVTTPIIPTSKKRSAGSASRIDTLADAEILFDRIPLDAISTSFTINGTAAIILAFYVAVGEKQGVDRASCAAPSRTTS